MEKGGRRREGCFNSCLGAKGLSPACTTSSRGIGYMHIEGVERETRQEAGGDRQGLSLTSTFPPAGPCIALQRVP